MSSFDYYFPNFFAREPILASKNNQGTSHPCWRNIEWPDEWYPKLKIYISEMILDSYEYVPIAYVVMHCMILP